MKSLFFLLILFYSFFSKANLYSKKVHSIDIERRYSYQTNWLKIADNEEDSLKELMKILIKSKTGKNILTNAYKKAKENGLTLLDVIKAGDGSLTDTTLIRRFSPDRPDLVTFESRSVVYVNKRLSVMNALLDLAHELAHFTYREPFNPYALNFSMADFVKSTVEGRGGEVDAYLVECNVMKELFPNEVMSRSNCHKVEDDMGTFSKRKGIEQFYKIGNYRNEFFEKFKNHKIRVELEKNISEDEALFISSAYGIPYPMAAIKEYESIMGRVCENDRKRLSLMGQQNNFRQLASENPDQNMNASGHDQVYLNMVQSFKTRCENFTL